GDVTAGEDAVAGRQTVAGAVDIGAVGPAIAGNALVVGGGHWRALEIGAIQVGTEAAGSVAGAPVDRNPRRQQGLAGEERARFDPGLAEQGALIDVGEDAGQPAPALGGLLEGPVPTAFILAV